MEVTKFSIELIDNVLKIIPEEGILDNSIYEIKIKGLKSLDQQKEMEDETFQICTAYTPMYTSLQAVKSLIEGLEIEDKNILYHIREASRFVDYMGIVGKIDKDRIPYEVDQYVRYRAAHDSLLRYYIEKASSVGAKGSLGEISFDNSSSLTDISKLLNYLNGKIKEWEDALRGYKFEGRAKPAVALRGQEASPIMTNLGIDLSRGISR